MVKKLTKKQVNEIFREEVLPYVIAQYGRDDRIAKAEAWNDYVDMLNKDRLVSDSQAFNWSNPY